MAEPETQSHLFLKGTEVEVTSEEESFKGSWFSATVKESFSSAFSTFKKRSTRKGALIQYKKLNPSGASLPLKDHVDPTLVRPLPPEEPPSSAPMVFEVGDIVDAKYRDGWWIGVVRKVLEGSRYRVYFDTLLDVVEFEGRDLRVHWDWVSGKWTRPGKQPISESVLGSGEAVEVNIGKGNVRNAWVPGVVIKENGDNTFLVRYQSQKKGDEAGMEKVSVDAEHIRPMPPPFGNRRYELLEKVDAWSDIGWRAGVITKVISGGRYNVFFKQGNEDKEFKESEIRPHAEWVDGKWKTKGVKIDSGDQDQLGDAQDGVEMVEVAVRYENETSAINPDNSGLITPQSMRFWSSKERPTNYDEAPPSDLMPQSKKVRLKGPNSNGFHSESTKNSVYGGALEATPSFKTLQSRKIRTVRSAIERSDALETANSHGKGFIIKNAIGPPPSFKTESYIQTMGKRRNIKKPLGRPPSAKVEGQISGKRHQKVVESYSRRVGGKTWKERPGTAPPEHAMSQASVKETKAADSAGQVTSGIEVETKEKEVPVILGLEAKGTRSVDPRQYSEETMANLTSGQRNTSKDQGDKSMELYLHEGGRSFQKRKRGRPRKLEVQSVKASKAGGGEVGSGNSAKILVVKDHPIDGAELVTWTEAECADESIGKTAGDMRKENTTSNAGALSNVVDDDQPLSMWFFGLPCSKVIEDSRFSSGKSADGGAEGGAEVVSALECYAIEVKRDHVEGEDRCLPFEKRSPVWKTIESMDVFKIVPQRPHFLPLEKCKEEYREGSAIGIMVTFASLFDKISSLRFEDSRTIFENTLESLCDLEKHGFDVAILRDRVIKLLLIKEGEAELLNETLNAERLINEQTSERRALSEKMDGITKKIAELKEEYDASKSKLEAVDFEIAKWQSDVDSMKARINNAQLHFEAVVAAPWRLP